MRSRREGLGGALLALLPLLFAGGASAQAPEGEAEAPSESAPAAEEAAESDAAPEAPSEPPVLLPAGEAPAAPATPAAPAALAAPARCGAPLAEYVRASVVRVRSGGRTSTGFFYTTARLVITTFAVIERGRGVRVTAADGRATDAEVVAHDQDRGLALLRVADPIGRPLQPSEGAPEVGQPIAVAGNPFDRARDAFGDEGEGLLRATLAFGQVAAVSEAATQLSAGLEEGHVGGPVLDCLGRVLGAVAGGGRLSSATALAVRVATLSELQESEGLEAPYLGNIQPLFGIGGLALIDDLGASFGAYLALGGVLFDQLSLITRVGIVGGATTESPGATELSLGRNLQRIESLIGYRFFFDIGGFLPVHVTLSGGAAVTREERTRAEIGLAQVDPSCDPSMGVCEQQIAITRTQVERWIARPVVSLGLLLGGNLEVGYSFEIDVDAPGTFVHAVRLGLLL